MAKFILKMISGVCGMLVVGTIYGLAMPVILKLPRDQSVSDTAYGLFGGPPLLLAGFIVGFFAASRIQERSR